VEQQWQSLKLLEECLAGAGLDEDEARATITPLRTLHELRSVLKGHAAPARRSVLEKQARAEFGSFRAHFADLAGQCDSALEVIIAKLKAFGIAGSGTN
jgi:hypothetical protein